MASTVQQSEMSAGEIVLGLLIERPDTCYQLDKRIAERVGSAQFSRGAAAGAVKRLLERDLVRPSEQEERASDPASMMSPVDTRSDAIPIVVGPRSVDGRRKTIYEPTPAGVEHFRRWLRASTQTPPVREELHAKIALWGSGDVSRLIEIVREAERSCMLQQQELDRRTRIERQRIAGAEEWERTMQLIVASGEATWWNARITWLQNVRVYLERLSERQQGTADARRWQAPGR